MTASQWLNATQMYSPLVLEVRSQKWVSLSCMQGVSEAAFSPEAPGENPFPCLVQLPEAACILWLVAPPSIFKGYHGSPCSHPRFSLTLTLLPIPYEDLCNYVGLTG